MVWQVKKFMFVLVAVLILIAATCGTISAATYDTYEGNISTTQLTYFKDILAGTSILDNYVLFRDDQNRYIMCVGDLEYSSNKFVLNEKGSLFTLDTTGNYNSYYTYSVTDITDFTLNTSNRIVYSDLGGFPQLEERGQRYEVLQTILIVIMCLCFVVRGFFRTR